MVVVIKKDEPLSEIKDSMKAIEEDKAPWKGFDTQKYAGKLKRGLDGLTF